MVQYQIDYCHVPIETTVPVAIPFNTPTQFLQAIMEGASGYEVAKIRVMYLRNLEKKEQGYLIPILSRYPPQKVEPKIDSKIDTCVGIIIVNGFNCALFFRKGEDPKEEKKEIKKEIKEESKIETKEEIKEESKEEKKDKGKSEKIGKNPPTKA